MLQVSNEIVKKVDPATKQKYIELSQSQSRTASSSPISGPAFSMTQFLNDLGSHILDTYMVVLMALDGIIQGNMVVKEKNLIEAIHFAIIDMYNENLIPSLQSCLQVTIKTALHRFAEMKMITISTYLNANGSRVSYF